MEWDKNGKLSVQGIHQYGSATLDESSIHYADQTEDYANEVLHDPLFDSDKRQGQIEHKYRLTGNCN